MSYFPPGSTVGILGGGQLGRMNILAGRPLGYRFHVYEPSPESTAGRVADRHFQAAYEDEEALAAFADSVDVITMEFENIPSEALAFLEGRRPLRPGRRALEVCQHRLREKRFLKEQGIPHVPFQEVEKPEGLRLALEALGGPVVVKTAAFGYDGKGQIKLESLEAGEEEKIWDQLGRPPRVVVEKWIDFQCEVSAVCARGISGATAVFPVAENRHLRHILHQSLVPARVSDDVAARAREIARQLAVKLEIVGLLAVEYFVGTDGALLVNEMAPRPHNSGHYTQNACPVSQFEQHVRMVAGLDPVTPFLHAPVVMTNLLGDLWEAGEPDWKVILDAPGAHLHLYDKGEARGGRKMGHFNLCAASRSAAVKKANTIFEQLRRFTGD